MRDLLYIFKTLIRVIGAIRDFIFYDSVKIGKYNIDIFTTLYILGYLYVAYNVYVIF